jgi:hypothetical protein
MEESVGWRTVPDLTIEQLTLALAVVAGVTLLSFLLILVLWARLRKVRREAFVLRGEHGDRDILSALGSWARRLDGIDKRVDGIAADHRRLEQADRVALQRFHLVRYDAFEDMGGRLSFSAALLDENGDGIVISSINGRTETRTYAKPIRNLTSDHNLSQEEGEAIAGAMANEGRSSQQVVSR